MPEIADSLLAFREQFFATCRDTSVETEQLRATLAMAAETHPALFAVHENARYLDKPEYQWDQGFFEQCLSEARDNFSRPRLEHLLAVRECLRRVKAKGFAPSIKDLAQEVDPLNSSFHPKNNLKKTLENKGVDLMLARHALRFEIYDASNGTEYLLNAVEWAEAKVPDIFEPYKVCMFNEAISENEQDWVSGYFDLQTEYLSGNFSKERFLHVIKVRQYLRDKGTEGFLPVRHPDLLAGESARDPGTASADAPHPNLPPALRTALMIGGAIAALLALLFSISR
jgi:hypothetical protein